MRLADTPITHERSFNGTDVYRLPVRRTTRTLGVAVLVFGLFAVGFALFWMLGPLTTALNPHTPITMRIFMGLFGATGLMPLGAGMVMIVCAALALLGRNEVILDNQGLRGVDRLGPLRWSRKPRPIQELAQLDVSLPTTSTKGGPSKPAPGFAALLVLTHEQAATEKGKGPRKPAGGWRDLLASVLAWGYPRDWLHALAQDLAEQCEASHGGRLFASHAPRLEVTESIAGDDDQPTLDSEGLEIVPPQPDTSTAELAETSAGITVHLPARGVWKASKGGLGFALIWLTFMAVFTGLMMKGSGPSLNVPPVSWLTVAFVGAFWGIGIVMLIGAINAGRSRGTIDLMAGTLLITRRSLFGEKQDEWTAEQLTSVHVGPSGVEVNDRPIYCLLVEANHAKPRKFFSERDDDELQWMASLIRRELGLH